MVSSRLLSAGLFLSISKAVVIPCDTLNNVVNNIAQPEDINVTPNVINFQGNFLVLNQLNCD